MNFVLGNRSVKQSGRLSQRLSGQFFLYYCVFSNIVGGKKAMIVFN